MNHYGIAILKYENSKNLVYINRTCSNSSPCFASNCPYASEKNSELQCIDLAAMESIDDHISEFERNNLFKSNYKSDEFEEYLKSSTVKIYSLNEHINEKHSSSNNNISQLISQEIHFEDYESGK